MPAATWIALVVSVLWTAPAHEATAPQEKSIELEFFDPFDRSSFQFRISEGAYIAIFELGQRRASLVYPAIGSELRRLRYGEATTLPEPDNFFAAGRHPLPPRSGRAWTGITETGFLMKGEHILIVASKRPYTFERLNDLYAAGLDETLAKRNSFGAVEDFTRDLLRAILPDFDADDWTAYLHWVRTT